MAVACFWFVQNRTITQVSFVPLAICFTNRNSFSHNSHKVVNAFSVAATIPQYVKGCEKKSLLCYCHIMWSKNDESNIFINDFHTPECESFKHSSVNGCVLIKKWGFSHILFWFWELQRFNIYNKYNRLTATVNYTRTYLNIIRKPHYDTNTRLNNQMHIL